MSNTSKVSNLKSIDYNTATINPFIGLAWYVGTDLAVTALCSLSFTPYLVTVLGCGHFGVVMTITAISFATFGIGYKLFTILRNHIKSKRKPINASNDAYYISKSNTNTLAVA